MGLLSGILKIFAKKQAYATLYLSRASRITAEEILQYAAGAKTTVTPLASGGWTRIVVAWPDVKVILTASTRPA